LDLDCRDPELEQAARDLVFDDRARADLRVVDDQVVRADAQRDAIAMCDRPQRVIARPDGVHAQRARGRVGVKLADGPRKQLQGCLDCSQICSCGLSR
jgi:hypothetical protein